MAIGTLKIGRTTIQWDGLDPDAVGAVTLAKPPQADRTSTEQDVAVALEDHLAEKGTSFTLHGGGPVFLHRTWGGLFAFAYELATQMREPFSYSGMARPGPRAASPDDDPDNPTIY